jgi:hypothetical protein
MARHSSCAIARRAERMQAAGHSHHGHGLRPKFTVFGQ